MREVVMLLLLALLVIGSNAQKIPFVYELNPERILKDEDNFFATKKILKEKKDFHLPKTIYPETYNVTLQPTFEGNFTFYGYTEIKGKVVSKTNKVVLHRGNLTLHQFYVYNNDVEIKVTNVSYDNVTEKFTMFLETYLLPESEVILNFKYEGILNDDMKGLYRSSYYDAEGNRRWLATTQFEPTYARLAFPCFDEPGFKAKFNLYIRRPKNYTALTNVPKYASQEESNDLVLDAFEETPKMSSYLVAIVVSDFAVMSNNASNVRIWAKKSNIHGGAYALDFGTKILNTFGELFGQKNPVPKTDMVAVPDFSAGAMENWGLITYKEHLLLQYDNESPDHLQQSIATIIAHECAHMWFGNMLSPKWWQFTWLNEGFANYFQYLGTSMVEPSWKVDEQYIVDTVHTALYYDSDLHANSVSKAVSSQKEIHSTFGTITYKKGGSVIRMMHQSFGSEIFLGALRDYIAKHLYGNVDSDDLWEALQNRIDQHKYELNVTVKELMNKWINEPGHPILMVNVTKNEITLSQRRSLLNNSESYKSKTSWYIPITFVSQQNSNITSAITNKWINQDTIIHFENATDNWIVFNNLEAGFYRVNYDTRSWYRIIRTLNSKNFKNIHQLNRAAIINDLMYFARAGLVDYEIALDALQYIAQETNFVPFKAALNGLAFLTWKLSGQKEYDLYVKHVLKLIEKTYKRVGFYDRKNDDKFTIMLRQDLNLLACKLGHEKCLLMANKSFAVWKRDVRKRVPANQRSVVYCNAIKKGSAADWEFLNNQYNATTDVYERLLILKSLGCTQNHQLLEKYLFYAMTNFDKAHQIRAQDSLSLFSTVSTAGLSNAKYMLEFLGKHHAKVAEYYGGYNIVVQLIALSSRSFTTQNQIDDFEKYIYENSETYSLVLEDLKNVLKNVKKELKWYTINSERISHWLYKNYPYDNEF